MSSLSYFSPLLLSIPITLIIMTFTISTQITRTEAFCVWNKQQAQLYSPPAILTFSTQKRRAAAWYPNRRDTPKPWCAVMDNNNNDNNNNDDENSTPPSFDMIELSQRIDKIRQFGAGIEDSPQKSPPLNVYIILFRPGTQWEGAHTIEYPLGSSQNLMLAFETKQDCVEFANVLEQTDEVQFANPQAQEMIYEGLCQYCESINVQVQFVPSGTELVPPLITVDQLDFDPVFDKKVDTLNDLFGLGDVEDDDDNLDGGGDGGGGGVLNDLEEESWG